VLADVVAMDVINSKNKKPRIIDQTRQVNQVLINA